MVTIWYIGVQSEGFLKAGSADLIAVGRAWLRNPFLAQSWAQELNVELTYGPQSNYCVQFRSKKDTAATGSVAVTPATTATSATNSVTTAAKSTITSTAPATATVATVTVSA